MQNEGTLQLWMVFAQHPRELRGCYSSHFRPQENHMKQIIQFPHCIGHRSFLLALWISACWTACCKSQMNLGNIVTPSIAAGDGTDKKEREDILHFYLLICESLWMVHIRTTVTAPKEVHPAFSQLSQICSSYIGHNADHCSSKTDGQLIAQIKKSWVQLHPVP